MCPVYFFLGATATDVDGVGDNTAAATADESAPIKPTRLHLLLGRGPQWSPLSLRHDRRRPLPRPLPLLLLLRDSRRGGVQQRRGWRRNWRRNRPVTNPNLERRARVVLARLVPSRGLWGLRTVRTRHRKVRRLDATLERDHYCTPALPMMALVGEYASLLTTLKSPRT